LNFITLKLTTPLVGPANQLPDRPNLLISMVASGKSVRVLAVWVTCGTA
jgi:hypothetical protein